MQLFKINVIKNSPIFQKFRLASDVELMDVKSTTGKAVSGWPSIRDVAMRAGVSPSSVSNVLNGKRSELDEIGQAVIAAVEELGYRPNAFAANLRRSSSRMIGVVIPDFSHSYYGRLVTALEACAIRSGYRIVAVSSRNDPQLEKSAIEEFASWKVAAIMLAPADETDMQHLLGTLSLPPVVVVDHLCEAMEVDCVGVDLVHLGETAVAKFCANLNGVVLVGSAFGRSRAADRRLEGIRNAAAALKGRVELEFLSCPDGIENMRTQLKKRLEGQPIAGVVTTDGAATLAAFEHICKHRPDLPLLAFDPEDWMKVIHPGLNYVFHPMADIAHRSWEQILFRIGGDQGPPRSVRLAGHDLRG